MVWAWTTETLLEGLRVPRWKKDALAALQAAKTLIYHQPNPSEHFKEAGVQVDHTCFNGTYRVVDRLQPPWTWSPGPLSAQHLATRHRAVFETLVGGTTLASMP